MIHVYFIATKMSSSLEEIMILNYDFNNLCEWFIDSKLSIYFGEDKTKSILFERGDKSNLSYKPLYKKGEDR